MSFRLKEKLRGSIAVLELSQEIHYVGSGNAVGVATVPAP